MHCSSVDENVDAAISETVHSTPPFTPPIPAAGTGERDKEQERDGADRASTESPRHWYEDYLSPPKKARRPQDQDHKNDDDVAFVEGENEVSRTLFSPRISSPKIFEKGSAAKSIASIVQGRAPIEAHRLPRELDFDTLMRSSYSPPPKNVNILQLSRRIELTASDDASDALSQKSDHSKNASSKVGKLIKESRVVSPDVSCIVDGTKETYAGWLDSDSCDNVVDDYSEALSRKSVKSRNDSSPAGTLAKEPKVVSPDLSCVIDRAKEGDEGGLDSDLIGDVTASIESADNRGSPDSCVEPEVSSIMGWSIWRDTSSGDVTKTGAPTNLLSNSPDDIIKDAVSKSKAPASPERVAGTESSKKLSNRETGATSSPSKCVRNFPPCLELKLGYPVNTSYDYDLYADDTRGRDFANRNARIINDVNLSMEVEKDSANAKYGELLVMEDKLDVPVVDTAVSGQLVIRSNARIKSLGEDGCESDKNRSSPSAATVDKVVDDSSDDLVIKRENKPNPETMYTKADAMFHMNVKEEVELNTAQESGVSAEFATVKVENSAVTFDQIRLGNKSQEIDGVVRGSVTSEVDRFPVGFLEELVERTTGFKAPSKTAKSDDFSSMLARRALEVAGQLPLRYAAKRDDFASSLAKSISKVETWRVSPNRAHVKGSIRLTKAGAKTPKGVVLIPCQSSRSTPGSSHTGETSDGFLSDYW
ncbi:hypothetical protein ACHAW5_007700 [Stephanodiscus triporus]|uniref:Uncharacterized protein n=1 Tax=Stephanodiscus triporus TaxID=2934178 RepID=A0ABD3MHB1_9STRA